MKKYIRKVLGLALTSFVFTGSALAANLVVFDTLELSGHTTDPWFDGSLDQNVELVQELTRNGMVSASRGAQFASSAETVWNNTETFSPAGPYLSFAASPKSGFEAWVTGFRFQQTTSLSAPAWARVQLSRDGFQTIIAEKDFFGRGEIGVGHDFRLSPAEKVVAGEVLSVRIYPYGLRGDGQEASLSAGAYRVKNLVLEGVSLAVDTVEVQSEERVALELSTETVPGSVDILQTTVDLEDWQAADAVVGDGEGRSFFSTTGEESRKFFRMRRD